jgi:N-glycosylase/DNA lyase
MLRQDPVECLFQFICSSNNHIQRIHGMVERLCTKYGTPLHLGAPGCRAAQGTPNGKRGGVFGVGDVDRSAWNSLSLFAFPTIEQLAAASEEALRADGFGYRAKFITGEGCREQG